MGGVNSPVRSFRSVGGTPVFMRSGRGAWLKDVDGRRYLDFCLSWGPLILGHAHREVLAAAQRALFRGSTFGAATESEAALAEAVRQAIPSMELVRLTSSGTEAAMSAVRLARAFTGRDLIVKFDGAYHGHADGLVTSAGVPEAWMQAVVNVPYNDAEALSRVFQRYHGRIAAVIVEPVAANMGVVLPEPGFLKALRSLTTQNGALLIFDEVITGFRLCYGGYQKLCRIQPDLTVLGKIVGGGLPLAAFGGRRKIMKLLAPLGPVYQAGTLSGNPVAVAAGLKALSLLKSSDPYADLEKKTQDLAQFIREEARIRKIPIQVQSTGSMFTVFFADSPIRDYSSAKRADAKAYGRFFHALREEGVYFPPAQWEAAFLSTEHGPKEIGFAKKAIRQVFREI